MVRSISTMSRHSRLQVDERVRPPSPSANGHKSGLPRHRRVVSDISSRNSQLQPEPIPELFLGAPLQDDVNERRTLQTQWTEALKKVQSLGGSHSSRWSGVATDLGRPKSMTTNRTLDQWNFYPGPSVKGETPIAEPDQTWKSQVAGAAPDRAWKSRGGSLENLDPGSDQTWKSRRGGEDLMRGGSRSRNSSVTAPLESLDDADQTRTSSQVGRAAYSSSSNLMKGGSRSRRSSVSTVLENLDTDQTWKSQVGRPEVSSSSESADATEDQVPSRLVHRTQSQRYGGVKAKPDARVLNKAVSMREGGAHADAVLEMAHAYSATVCGLPLALQCASCGRSLGMIVQGNPGVDVAFCSACRPPEVQWKNGRKKSKYGIVRICRRLLRLDRKN